MRATHGLADPVATAEAAVMAVLAAEVAAVELAERFVAELAAATEDDRAALVQAVGLLGLEGLGPWRFNCGEGTP
jgi:hypothetical protein